MNIKNIKDHLREIEKINGKVDFTVAPLTYRLFWMFNIAITPPLLDNSLGVITFHAFLSITSSIIFTSIMQRPVTAIWFSHIFILYGMFSALVACLYKNQYGLANLSTEGIKRENFLINVSIDYLKNNYQSFTKTFWHALNAGFFGLLMPLSVVAIFHFFIRNIEGFDSIIISSIVYLLVCSIIIAAFCRKNLTSTLNISLQYLSRL
ncbi:MAG: hypothetical protein HQK50_00085 [Oligoflexia bacterium]|nr:hypothetical protein [Oligoflexia bacterium]MBF0363932.1 hypothetical protein [Oligoflexia bacterium]